MRDTNSTVGFSRAFYWLAHVFLIAGIAWLGVAIFFFAKSDNNLYMVYGFINTVLSLAVYVILDRLAKISVDYRFRGLNSLDEHDNRD
jgi:hypothetical protein